MLRVGLAGLAGILAFGAAATGCLQRDVEPSQPNTTNIFVDRITVSVVDKIDLLFMIDNSISMADKQEILDAAVPQLVNRLVDPICVDPGLTPQDPDVPCGDNSSADGCSCGEAEFRAVDDIHIGIVTSSLGGHGAGLCTPPHEQWNPTQNDSGHLITRDRTGGAVATWNDQGFLSWDPNNSARNPDVLIPGIADRDTLVSSFRNLVTGPGEQGCGYEASLEAWYRFLIDPEPPVDITLNPDTQQAEPVGIDEALLAQRAQFLRPDSLVAIIMMSDENDCSVQDYGFGWFVTNTVEGTMPRSTTQCDTNPNDLCCLSCIQATWPEGCSNPQGDPKCQAGLLHPNTEDRLNLRCYEQKRRFGLDFLYPTQRYVNALRLHEVPRRDGTMAPNPLYSHSDHLLAADYADLQPRIDDNLVFLAGIIGVPWQDIATEESLTGAGLTYLTANQISTDPISPGGLWDVILGMPEASPPVPPSDPFMLEQVFPRPEGTPNPRVPAIAIEAPRDGSGGNPINGHEYTIENNGDLQYACIFPLAQSKDCSPAVIDAGVGCDCKEIPGVSQRPLCEGTTQTYAKAYPGLRFLRVLRDYGANSIVASICPKNTTGQADDASYGYNPAVAAIIDRLKEALQGTCLPRQLATDDAGNVLCQVVEVTTSGGPSCATPGRAEVEPDVAAAVIQRMRALDLCGTAALRCEDVHMCKILPVGPDQAAIDNCLNDEDAALWVYGYCYIDAMTDQNDDGVIQCQVAGDPDCLGNPLLVADCPAAQRRLLRFVSPANLGPNDVQLPFPNSTVFVACQGQAFRTD